MAYRLFISAACPMPGGMAYRVDGVEPRLPDADVRRDAIQQAIDLAGLESRDGCFAWLVNSREREAFENLVVPEGGTWPENRLEDMPRHLFFDPAQVMDSLIRVQEGARPSVPNNPEFYSFRVVGASPEPRFSLDLLVTSALVDGEAWHLQGGKHFCFASREPVPYGESCPPGTLIRDFIREPASAPVVGYVFAERSSPGAPARYVADLRASLNAQPDEIHVKAAGAWDQVNEPLEKILNVCRHALQNGCLLDVMHSA